MKTLAKFWVAIVAALTLAAFTAQAQTNTTTTSTNTPSATAKPKPKGKRYSGKITKVDSDAKTITFSMASGTSHTVHITSKTKIKKDNEPATLADAAEGLQVSGTYRADDAGDWQASTVNIGQTKAKATTTPPATDKQ